MANPADHVTVLLTEAIDALAVEPGKWYVDATYGRGGHSREIIARGGHVIAFDMDQEAIEYAQQQEAENIAQHRLILIRSNFDQLKVEIDKLRAVKKLTIHGVLFDFGTSTNQLMSDSRGFSFESEAGLDMRMDMRLGVTAEDMLRVLTEKQLAEAFRELGGEKEAKATARAAKTYVMNHSPVSAKGLAEAIARGKYEKRGKIHPATKVFQALRMMVNLEIDNIKHGLPQAREILEPKGRIVTIAFHEGEDRVAKHTFISWERQGKGRRLLKDALIPSSEEIERNPRSRSAKMRVFIVC